MLSPKIRTTLITLIAAGSFATVTIAPAVSQAEDNSYSHATECEQLRQETEALEGAAYVAKLAGKKDLATYYSAEASQREADAMSIGCNWTGGEAPDVEAHHGKAGALEHVVTVTSPNRHSRPVAVKVPKAKVSKGSKASKKVSNVDSWNTPTVTKV